MQLRCENQSAEYDRWRSNGHALAVYDPVTTDDTKLFHRVPSNGHKVHIGVLRHRKPGLYTKVTNYLDDAVTKAGSNAIEALDTEESAKGKGLGRLRCHGRYLTANTRSNLYRNHVWPPGSLTSARAPWPQARARAASHLHASPIFSSNGPVGHRPRSSPDIQLCVAAAALYLLCVGNLVPQ